MQFRGNIDKESAKCNPESTLLIDLKNALMGEANNFTGLLMRLMFKSDPINFYKLSTVYPKEAELVTKYKQGLINLF